MPTEPLSITEAAKKLAMDVEGVRGWLKKRPELFGRPMYGRVGPHPRQHRFITPEDFATLFALRFRLVPWRRRGK